MSSSHTRPPVQIVHRHRMLAGSQPSGPRREVTAGVLVGLMAVVLLGGFSAHAAMPRGAPQPTAQLSSSPPAFGISPPRERSTPRLLTNHGAPDSPTMRTIRILAHGSRPTRMTGLKGTVTLIDDGFEGSFPGSTWVVYNTSSATWGVSTYRSSSGSRSLWCAAGGSSPQPAGADYRPNMEEWLVAGPFDFTDAEDATLESDIWLEIGSGDALKLGYSTNGSSYSTVEVTPTSGWEHQAIDIGKMAPDVLGEPEVWIALVFVSDGSGQREGAYIDNVLFTKEVSGSCTYSISPTQASYGAGGGSGSVSVSASSSSCSWTASSNASWIDITSGSSGTGSGTVHYSVASNGSSSSRSGTMTIAGKTFTVQQSGSGGGDWSCGNAGYDDDTAAGAAWFGGAQAGDPDKMIAVRFDLADFGYQPGEAQITGFCARNTVDWGDVWPNEVFIYPDDGGLPDVDSALGHGTIHTGDGSGDSVVTLSSPITLQGDFWLVARGDPMWSGEDFNIEFDDGPGTGNSYISSNGVNDLALAVYDDFPNGVNYMLRAYLEAASGCTYSISPTQASYGSGGGSGTVSVSASSGSCSWTASSNVSWAHITSGSSGTGSGTVHYTVDSNNSSSQRDGTMTIAGHTFSLQQSGASESDYTYVVGGVAHNGGNKGTEWYSDIGVVNTESTSASLSLTFYSGAASVTRNHTLPAYGTVTWRNVVETLFNVSSAAERQGSVVVASDRRLVVAARTYNQSATGTFGQYLPGLLESQCLHNGDEGFIPLLERSSDFRSNLGAVQVGGGSCTVEVRLYDSSGSQLGSPYSMTVSSKRWKQRNDIFGACGVSGNSFATSAVVRPQSSGCAVWAYASVIDNHTGSGTLIPARIP